LNRDVVSVDLSVVHVRDGAVGFFLFDEIDVSLSLRNVRSSIDLNFYFFDFSEMSKNFF